MTDEMLGGAPLPMHAAGRIELTFSGEDLDAASHFELAPSGGDAWLELPFPLVFRREPSTPLVQRSSEWCLPLGWRVRSVDGRFSATLPTTAPPGETVSVELVRAG